MPLSKAVEALALGVGADCAVLSRHPMSQQAPSEISIYDAMDNGAVSRPYCKDVMGYLYSMARPATVWFLSDHLEDDNWEMAAGLDAWCEMRGIEDIVVLSLEVSVSQRDLVEFHFTRSLDYSERRELEGVAPTLTRAWSGRKAGLVTQAKMDDRMIRHREAARRAQADKARVPILGMDNPANLSRAETRVCVLLSRGLSVKAVVSELGLAEATIRSHLGSIYQKTGVAGIQELMYRLMSSTSEHAATPHVRRRA